MQIRPKPEKYWVGKLVEAWMKLWLLHGNGNRKLEIELFF
jgi:hypothetical protein